MKKALIGIFCFLMAFSVCAEEKVYLWPGKKGPGSENFTAKQATKTKGDGSIASISAVSEPYFTVHKAKKSKNKKAGIIMIPGGAHVELAVSGMTEPAEKYCAEGYTCFVLVLRLPENGHADPIAAPLQDAQRAIRLIRSQAAKYGIDPNKIGVFGESAGGQDAARLAVCYDEKTYEPVDEADAVSARPDFQVLRVPAVGMDIVGTVVPIISKVTPNTPKAFIVSASNDGTAKVKTNALAYYEALWTQAVDSELHVFQSGGHHLDAASDKIWLDLSVNWLNEYVK